MSVVFANNAATTLAAAITSTSATTITVTSSSSFPSISGSEYFYATIDDGTNKEIVKVTGVSSETWTIVRAQDGTSARTFANGIDVELRNNAAMLSDIKSHFSLADNENLNIGAGNDLFFVHNGTNSFIQNATGDLYIENAANDKDIIFRSDDGSGGLTTYFRLDGSLTKTYFEQNVQFNDNVKIQFGAGADLSLSHDGTDSHISNSIGDLFITNNNDDKDIILKSDDGSGGVAEYIRLDGSAAKTLFSKDSQHADSVKALFGGSDDLQIYHDATDSFIDNTTGDLYLTNKADDKDIIFRSDDGSGGFTTYFKVDGSEVRTEFAKDTRHTDNVKALFGGGDDLQIYHDGSDSWIQDNGTGNLNIKSNGTFINFLDGSNNLMAYMVPGGAVGLYHNTSAKLATTSSGVSVTGGLTTSGASTIDELTVSNDTTLSGGAAFAGDATFGDSNKAKFGAGNDLEIYHDSSNSFIDETGTGNLYVRSNSILHLMSDDIRLMNNANSETILKGVVNGAVELYHDNSKKLETNTNGVAVTGAATGTLTTDNDGSFDMAASNNFKCTPSGNFTLTFTNIVSQSGNILLINSGGHTVSAHTNSKVDANLLATVSTAGTYLISYFSDGTNVYLTNSAIYT